jgi:NADH-quinone oxidoreductase subunit L
MTAFYMARQVFMVFSGKPATSGAEQAPESAPRMVWPLAFLAVFAVLLGLVGVPGDFSILGLEVGRILGNNPFHYFMGTLSTGAHFETHPFNAVPAALSIGAAASGWALGYLLYGKEPERARAADPMARLGGLWRLLNQKYYVDEVYDATFIRGTVGFAGLNSLFDRYVVDGLVNGVSMASERFARANGWVDRVLVDGTVNLIAYVNNEMSRWLKYLQSGRIQQYLLVVFLGLLALLMPLVL